MTSIAERTIWVGLVDVGPCGPRSPFVERPGAYTNALAAAADEVEFRDRVTQFFRTIDLEVRSFEDVEPLVNRQKTNDVPKKILELGKRAGTSGEVQYDTFYLYRNE